MTAPNLQEISQQLDSDSTRDRRLALVALRDVDPIDAVRSQLRYPLYGNLCSRD
jgi:hypothetical protein